MIVAFEKDDFLRQAPEHVDKLLEAINWPDYPLRLTINNNNGKPKTPKQFTLRCGWCTVDGKYMKSNDYNE